MNHCKHTYVNGNKKGQQCGRACRLELCFQHQAQKKQQPKNEEPKVPIHTKKTVKPKDDKYITELEVVYLQNRPAKSSKQQIIYGSNSSSSSYSDFDSDTYSDSDSSSY